MNMPLIFEEMHQDTPIVTKKDIHATVLHAAKLKSSNKISLEDFKIILGLSIAMELDIDMKNKFNKKFLKFFGE